MAQGRQGPRHDLLASLQLRFEGAVRISRERLRAVLVAMTRKRPLADQATKTYAASLARSPRYRERLEAVAKRRANGDGAVMTPTDFGERFVHE